ncbi:MEMO1 family [Gymnopilus junonius]|uniref:MEMO1 family n=1 Tax=Gymnopilus junonius TaxID=109634 RepID=A0A9P5NY06_GYMJU|nr:MEMO1 family [Gymnopilus junonius]
MHMRHATLIASTVFLLVAMTIRYYSSALTIRSASHAGSWYNSEESVLDAELTKWLAKVGKTEEPYPIKQAKAIIAPHAGYSYSGPAAAWAYKSIDTSAIKKVFILGPSHHFFIEGCALSKCTQYGTPLGNLPLDLDIIKELKATGKFQTMGITPDEDEHSIEMHLPYVRKVFQGKDIQIVPIVVGAIKKDKESIYGTILAPYLARDDTFFVVSSDFCHWGTRFSYTYYYPDPAPSDEPAMHLSLATPLPSTSIRPIYESITKLDREAMDILTIPPSTPAEAHTKFVEYLEETGNTICGRHPIGVLLERQNIKPVLKWVRYEQSSRCHSLRDSSVSYASAYIRF